MAVKPWLGVVQHSVPTSYKPHPGEKAAPDASLVLEYVHGYRCEDARNNLRYTRSGKVVYHTAALGVVMDPVEGKGKGDAEAKGGYEQKHFFEHTDDILCLAIHPEKNYVATGEVGPHPLICVWDTTTMECMARITGVLTKGICQICFSNDGKYLAASAADDYHCIAVYEWEKCTLTAKSAGKSRGNAGLVAAGQGSRANLLSMAFNPANNTIAAPGIKEVNFITFANGTIKVKKGINWGSNKHQAILCGAYVGTSLVTGTFSGKLFVWKENTLSNVLNAHKSCVDSVWSRDANKGFLSGGSDGVVIVWGPTFNQLHTINIAGNKAINCLMPRVRSVCESPEGNILVGTRSGEIIEFRQDKPRILMRSHFKDDLWGLAINPKKPEYATLGQDAMFAIWDVLEHKQKMVSKFPC